MFKIIVDKIEKQGSVRNPFQI